MQLNKTHFFAQEPLRILSERVSTGRFFSFSLLFSIGAVFSLISCIEEFDPGINDYDNLLVVDGNILKGDSIQKILISRSTSLEERSFVPVSGCYVEVIDGLGNEFIFEESVSGVYCSCIPQQLLDYKSKFQLYIRTPEDVEYKSGFEPLLESSIIDSVYYEIENYQSSSEQHEIGLQFYTDLKAPDDATKNYGWIVEETWEMHTSYSIDGYWTRGSFSYPLYHPVSDSVSICWSTAPIREVFVSSTENLTLNEKKKIPLNFMPATSSKLNIKYSILVKQFPLSGNAYKYFKNNYIASKESGGLYQKQPAQSRGNIRNIGDSTEIVLGYFWASSYTEKRIFFDGPLTEIHLDCKFMDCLPPCNLMERLLGSGREVMFLVAIQFAKGYPDSVSYWGYPYDQTCIDCTAEGGTTTKPEFFD